MGEVQAQPAYPRGLDFEQVWAALMEDREQLKRSREEFDRRMQETDRRMQETDRQMKETDRQMKETDKRFGNFTNRFGEVVEYMVVPNLLIKFKELGLYFERGAKCVVTDYGNGVSFEVDNFLENGDKAMLVEVKTKLTAEDVQDHIERMEKMRKYADLRGDNRAFLGAVAGVVMTLNVKDYALKQGFYVIEPSGETFNITPPNGQPKEW